MLIWWYALAVNIFLWLKTFQISYAPLPLIVVVIFGLYDAIYKIKKEEEYALELMLASIGICIILLITFIDTVSFSIYLTLIILIYLLKKGKNCFIYPPLDIRIANAFSFISSSLTYLLLNASINNEVEKSIPLIPFSVNVITEFVILIKISKRKINGLTENYCNQLAYNRMLFSISTIVMFIVAICYTIDIIPQYILFSISTAFYAAALIYIHFDQITNIRCKPMYTNLKT